MPQPYCGNRGRSYDHSEMKGLRFWRRISLLPGVQLNLSKSGPSVSLGRRGAKITVGRGGTRTTFGLPGSGLSVTRRIPWPRSHPPGLAIEDPHHVSHRAPASIKPVKYVVAEQSGIGSVVPTRHATRDWALPSAKILSRFGRHDEFE